MPLGRRAALGSIRRRLVRLLGSLFALAFLIVGPAHATTFCGQTIAPEIVAQAAALKNDPDLIYEFVYNDIQTLPQHGSLKGSLGALLDRSGTEVDQAELMVQLLQAAGYSTAGFQTGDITIDAAQLTGWLGTDNSPYGSGILLGDGGYAVTSTLDEGGTHLLYVTVPWAWVTVDIAGATYIFDPAGKRANGYSRTTGISNLGAALGYMTPDEKSAFIADAEAGSSSNASTAGGWWIRGLNRTNVRSHLQRYATNLISYVRANAPSASTADIIGGTRIVPLAIGTHQRITAAAGFSYLAGATTNYSCIPTGLRTVFTLTIPGAATQTFNTSDLSGHRLTLFLDSADRPVLRLDGTVLVTAPAPTTSPLQLTITLVHNAYAAPFADITATSPLSSWMTALKVATGANATYVIANSWGATSQSMVERHRLLLKQYSAQYPGNATAEPVLGESLTNMGFTWLAQNTRNVRSVDQISGTATIYQFALGIVGIRPVGIGSGPFVDLPINLFASVQRIAQPNSANPTPSVSAAFYSWAMLSSALESSIIEQTQPSAVAVSTVKFVDIANQNNDQIYEFNNSDEPANNAAFFNSNYSSYLNSWSSTDRANAHTLVNSIPTNRLIAPQNARTINSLWTGVGFFALQEDGYVVRALISGGLSGGFSASPVTDPQFVSNIQITVSPSLFTAGVNWSDNATQPSSWLARLWADPVNRITGAFTNNNVDLAIGSAGLPIGLQFQRFYDSTAYLDKGPLGLGWTSNFSITAKADSNGFVGMGVNSPIEGAAAIAAIYVVQDILNDGVDTKKTLDRVVIADLAMAWLEDQFNDNIVAIEQPESVSQFVKLPDGSYDPPLGTADQLALVSGAYVLTQKDGTVVNFNGPGTGAPGAIARWHSPAGPTVTYNYNGAGNLASVATGSGAAGTNRTLTLSYNGSNLLTGVSDGHDRSVSYSYDAAGEMTSFTDPLGNVTTYRYDPATPGRMTQYFHPSQPSVAVITNTYDTSGRVTAQTDANGDTTHLYASGTRTEMDDPLGNAQITYFSDTGLDLVDIDGLGNQTVNTYDGLNRPTSTTMPEGDSVSYAYDANSNPITMTATPKPGSGLSPLTTTVAYDLKWNAPARVTDPLGLVTSYLYDAATGNLVKVLADDGSGADHSSIVTAQFTYNARGQMLTATDAGDTVTATAYDTEGNPTSITRDAGGLNLVTSITYDAFGDVLTTTDPNGHVSSSAYDARRRVTSTTGPAVGAGPLVTSFTYDADDHLLQTRQSAAGTVLRTTGSTYTAVGQVETAIDAKGNVTHFAYDAAGHTSSVTDPMFHVTAYGYDANGRRTQVSNPAIQPGPLSQLSFTANGKPHVLTDANGNAVTLSYDGFDRLAATAYPGGSTEALTYDGDGNILTRTTRAGDTIAYAYTTLNRLCSKTVGPTPTPCTAASSAYPTVWYTYDTRGRLMGARDNGAALAAVSTQGSFSASAVYDAVNRATSVNFSPAPAQAAPSASSVTFTHTYDRDNRRIRQTTTDTGWWQVPSAPSSTGYSANALNQYTAVGSASPGYDGNGNLASDGTFLYCHDAESRLTAILSSGSCASPGTVVASYAYDAAGHRKSRTAGGTTTVYVSGAGGEDDLEYDGTSGATRTWYTYGADGVANRVDVSVGTRTTLVPDLQGSIVGSLDSATGTMTRWGYGPYGENPALATAGPAYTGQHHDPETSGSASQPSGLYDYHARIYSPALGRFLETDPAGDSATNLYAYVGNDPLNATDPSGMFAEGLSTLGNTEMAGLNYDVGLASDYGQFLARQSGLDRVYNDIQGLQSEIVRDPLRGLNDLGNGLAGIPLGGAFGGVAGGAERAGLAAEDELLGASPVNPSGSLTNCGNCVVAMDATLAGRPASALPGELTRTTDLEAIYADVFPRTKNVFSPVTGPKEVAQILSRFGSGSRAIVSGEYLDPTLPGHAFNAANMDGVVVFVDGQLNISGPELFGGLRNFKILMTSLGRRR